jgi:hypothetical protein
MRDNDEIDCCELLPDIQPTKAIPRQKRFAFQSGDQIGLILAKTFIRFN